MKPLMKGCIDCESIYLCFCNEFKECPKIEIATAGLGIPYKPKKDEFIYVKKMPFGVYMGLKHIVERLGVI